MQDLKEVAITKLYKSLFYYRYIDDIIFAFPSDKINDIKLLISLHTQLQFTMEVDIDNKLNFIDTTLIIKLLIVHNLNY